MAWNPSTRFKSLRLSSSLVERLLEAQGVGGSIPSSVITLAPSGVSQINAAVTYFEEACAYKRAIHALTLRASSAQPGLSEAQLAQRKMIIAVACKLLEDEIAQLIPLAITTWQTATQPDAPPDLIQP